MNKHLKKNQQEICWVERVSLSNCTAKPIAWKLILKLDWNSHENRLQIREKWWPNVADEWRMMLLVQKMRLQIFSINFSFINFDKRLRHLNRSTAGRLERQNGKPIKRPVPLNTLKLLSCVGRPFNKMQHAVELVLESQPTSRKKWVFFSEKNLSREVHKSEREN